MSFKRYFPLFLSMALAPDLAVAEEPGRVIGLLALPQLFGSADDVCDRNESQPVAIFDSVDSESPVGQIRVDRPWEFPAEGGCMGREIGVHVPADGEGQRLPTEEYGYETPGAVVRGRGEDRYEIDLGKSTGWIEPRADAVFYPFEDLVRNRKTYLTDVWGGQLCAGPGGEGPCHAFRSDSDFGMLVDVLDVRTENGEYWLEIEIPAEHLCGRAPPNTPKKTGWVPGHDTGGRPVVWFYSRGC